MLQCRNVQDQRPDSNRRPFQMLRSMADLFIMVKAYIIGRRFEKVRNDHIFENLKKRHRFENWLTSFL
jgi:hypothetical protein